MSLLLVPSSASRRIFPMLNRSHYKVAGESRGSITKLLENLEDPLQVGGGGGGGGGLNPPSSLIL